MDGVYQTAVADLTQSEHEGVTVVPLLSKLLWEDRARGSSSLTGGREDFL
jgi:hypothetical protein